MTLTNRWANRWEKMFDRYAKVRTLDVLRGMPDRQLEDLGFSPELLRAGVKGWPWRLTEEPTSTAQVVTPIAATATAVGTSVENAACNQAQAAPVAA